jgi:DNA (cytosine-5)-methyltransferase 1
MGDVCQTVTSSWGTGGGNIPFVQNIYSMQGNLIGRDIGGPNGLGVSENEPMYTLTKTDVHAVAFTTEQTPKFNLQQALTLTQSEHKHNQCVMSWDAELNPHENKSGTLIRGGQGGRTDGVAIPYDLYQITSPLNGQKRENGDPCHTLARDNAAHASITNGMMVRRLTPVECERLQGFPDGYTDIKPNNKETPDGHRYKALGNSMAVPVMRWIGERINNYERV